MENKHSEIQPNENNNLPSQGIFGQGGTDLSKVLSQALEDIGKANPNIPKHIIMITDGDNGDMIESITTTTYNKEQQKKALKEIPETEFNETINPNPEKKIEWKEALRQHLKNNPREFVSVSDVAERIKSVNSHLNSENSHDNKPKLK